MYVAQWDNQDINETSWLSFCDFQSVYWLRSSDIQAEQTGLASSEKHDGAIHSTFSPRLYAQSLLTGLNSLTYEVRLVSLHLQKRWTHVIAYVKQNMWFSNVQTNGGLAVSYVFEVLIKRADSGGGLSPGCLGGYTLVLWRFILTLTLRIMCLCYCSFTHLTLIHLNPSIKAGPLTLLPILCAHLQLMFINRTCGGAFE